LTAIQRLAKFQLTANFSNGHVSAASNRQLDPRNLGEPHSNNIQVTEVIASIELKAHLLADLRDRASLREWRNIQEHWASWFSVKYRQ